MTGRLQDKACIVTGAGRGIGQRDRRSPSLARAPSPRQRRGYGGRRRRRGEVRSPTGKGPAANNDAIGTVEAAESLLSDALEAFGEVDVLVNNAGILRDEMLHNMSEEDFDIVIQVHLKGTWACGRAVVQHWRPLAKAELEAGTRTCIARSLTSRRRPDLIGAVGQSNYAAAKMGIVGLTKTWAKELGPSVDQRQRRVPDRSDGDDRASAAGSGSRQEEDGPVPAGRYGSPEEIAPAFVFLASAESELHHRAGPLRGWRLVI